jgi:hypothetical protein
VENGGAFSVRRSKDDVLLEEIQFLRQMLADCNEEKRIQAANAVWGINGYQWCAMFALGQDEDGMIYPCQQLVNVSPDFVIDWCFSVFFCDMFWMIEPAQYAPAFHCEHSMQSAQAQKDQKADLIVL